MSSDNQNLQEQYDQYRHARMEAAEIANLIDFYTPLRPAINSTSVTAVASVHTATSKQQGAIEQNGKR